ncbi:hypothetical protein ACGIF2_07025 [Cellulomonas sp. P22]|uniref:hypothetical protein n=1 Tax=Cellulomonas sp. P22 TaxID=3373189 RepID=UPI0037AB358C
MSGTASRATEAEAARPAGHLSRSWGAVARWWTSPVPLARVAVLRAVIYLFVVYDVLALTNDVIPHGYAPDLYQPTLIGRVLPFPTPSPGVGWFLLVTIVVGALVAATGLLPRIAGGVVAVAFLAWMVNSQGFSYVSHDHLALIVATLVLPTVGRARFTDLRPSEAAGWAVRAVQVATVATYVGSAASKISRTGSPWAWANGAVFTWAIMRRGSHLITWTLEYPWVLRLSQWGLLTIEILSPVVFWLRGRWLAVAISFFLLFHLATYLSLGIHFLPTVVCWASFMPLERIVPPVQRAWRRVTRRGAAPGPVTAAG